MKRKLEKLIQKYSDCQKALIRGLDNSLIFYIAQSVNDRPLMDYAIEQGFDNKFSCDFINTILDAFEEL